MRAPLPAAAARSSLTRESILNGAQSVICLRGLSPRTNGSKGALERRGPWQYAHAVTRFVLDPQGLIDFVRDGQPLAAGHQLVAPSAIRSQALGLLLVAVRQGTITEREALALHEGMTELKMRLLGDRVSRRAAWNLACEHDWDDLRHAEYLAITQLQADALVAGDRELAQRAAGLVTLAPASALSS
jgi:hypothetical protein